MTHINKGVLVPGQGSKSFKNAYYGSYICITQQLNKYIHRKHLPTLSRLYLSIKGGK